MSSKEFRFFCRILKCSSRQLCLRKSVLGQWEPVISSNSLDGQVHCGKNGGDDVGVAPVCLPFTLPSHSLLSLFTSVPREPPMEPQHGCFLCGDRKHFWEGMCVKWSPSKFQRNSFFKEETNSSVKQNSTVPAGGVGASLFVAEGRITEGKKLPKPGFRLAEQIWLL